MATKINKKQLGQDVLDLISSGGGALLKDIISNVTVGAAPSGTKFPEGQTLTEFAEALLRKDITPTIQTSFSGSGIKEIGTVVNGTTMTLKITNLAAITVPIDRIEFYMGNTLLDTQPFVSGTNTYTFVYNSTINTNSQAKAKLIYNTNSIAQGIGDFTFVYGSFYGPTKASFIDSAIANTLITSFTKSIKNSKALTWSNISVNDERFCYMYPASMGTLGSIKDGNGFDQTNGYTRYQVDITYPTNNEVVSYYVYLLNDPTTGSGFTQIYS